MQDFRNKTAATKDRGYELITQFVILRPIIRLSKHAHSNAIFSYLSHQINEVLRALEKAVRNGLTFLNRLD